jgi:AcrR family transcriptional regulator
MKRQRIEQPEVRKAQILTAAETAMGEKGYHGIRMDDVAQRAGVSKGTLYLYFKDKEDLLAGLLSGISKEYEERFASIPNLNKLPPLEKLRRIVEEVVVGMRKHRDFFAQISMMKPEAYGKKAARALKEGFRNHLAFLSGILAEGTAVGIFRKCDTRIAAFVLMTLGRSLTTLDADLLPLKDNPEALAGTVMDFFLKGVEA